jgi:hypothetical protein
MGGSPHRSQKYGEFHHWKKGNLRRKEVKNIIQKPPKNINEITPQLNSLLVGNRKT